MGEARFSHDPPRHHPTGHGDRRLLLLQRRLGFAAVARVEVGGERVALEVVRKGIALLAQSIQLGTPLSDLIAFVDVGHGSLITAPWSFVICP